MRGSNRDKYSFYYVNVDSIVYYNGGDSTISQFDYVVNFSNL